MSQPPASKWSTAGRLLFVSFSLVFVIAVQAGLHLVDGAPYLGSLLRSFVPPLTLWIAAGLGVALTGWQVWRILAGGGLRFALLGVAALTPAMAGAAHAVLEATAFSEVVTSGVTTAEDAALITLEGLQSVAASGTVTHSLSAALLVVCLLAVSVRARAHGLRPQAAPLLCLGGLVIAACAASAAGVSTLRDFSSAHEALWQLGQSASTAPDALIPVLSPVSTPSPLLGLVGLFGLVALAFAVRTTHQRVRRAISVAAVMATLLLVAGAQQLAGAQWQALSAVVLTRHLAAQR